MRFANAFLLAFGLLMTAAVMTDAKGRTCSNPIDIRMNELYEGDTTNAEASPISCDRYRYSPFGLWYHYVGEGKAVVIDTCDQRTDFDTVIFVFDSCELGPMGHIDQCVAMDDDGCNMRQSRVQFTAEAMHNYYIFVAGYSNDTGIFYLSTDVVLPPTHYQCHKALEVNQFPYSASGETGTCLPVRDTCQDTMSSGLWYHLTGTGQPFIAHTCSLHTDYDSVINVFASCSEDAGADDCVASNNDACYKASLVNWRSVQNSDYWVMVTGYHNARGQFSLAIEQRSMNPYSRCNEPIVITSIPYYYSGQTDYLDTTFSECRNAENQHAMYFRLRGADRKIIATTCTSASTVNDSVIDVYSDCNSVTGEPSKCVAYNDDYCGLGAAVVFYAAAETYYLAVSAASPTLEGVYFSLAILPYEEVINTQCWYATEVENIPDSFMGTTRDRATTTQTCDGTKTERRGAWYRYTHGDEDEIVTASTCNVQNMLLARLEVYRDCNDMMCTAQAYPDESTNCTTVTFTARKGDTYNIFVTASDPSTPGAYFQMDLYFESPSTHSKCEDAYFVNRGQLPYRLQDNTMMSEFSYSSCSNRTKKGIWVTVIGTGTKLVATTCDSRTGYDTVLELYDRCPEETEPGVGCLDVNDDHPSCNRASEIEFPTEAGAYYWLFVTGFASNTGIFVLNIYDKSGMPNPTCHLAKGIHEMPFYDYGLTTYNEMSNASCRKAMRKGSWFEVVGTGRWVTVSTCNVETNYATEIEIYLACTPYGGEICVNHNHDYKCAPKTEITFAAIRGELFYIFVTGVDETVMAEGFFGVNVYEGAELPHTPSGSSHPEKGGMSGFGKFMVVAASVAGCGLVAALSAVAFGLYKKRHISYQEITTNDST